MDPDTLGLVSEIASGPLGDARFIIKRRLTNYEAASRTLHKTAYVWEASRGRSATTQVLGRGPFEIVTSEASLILFGPNTGFRDRFGDDALRNLSTSARMLIGNRDFTTAGSFTSTSRLSIFGDTQFIVNGDLTIEAGFFDLSPLTGYAAIGDPGFPLDPADVDSNLLVDGNFNLAVASSLRLDVYDTAITATMTVNGTAVFAGSLEAAVEDVSLLTSSDTFTVLTASQITGQFANVPSGGRVDAYGDPNGDPIGSFLVTYDNTTLVLSDFQPAGDAGERRKPAPGRSWLERRSSPDRGNE